MHYYQHHIGDFIKDTANLNDHQLVTYMRMIWAYYSEEKPLADAPEDIAFAMRSDEKTVGLILRHYFKETPDGWRHGRCDREIAGFHGKKEKAAASANARWTNAKNNANAMRTHSERNATEHKNDANQEPITNNQEDQEHLSSADDEPGQKITYSAIADLYNRVCGDVLPRCVALNKKRKTNIRNLCGMTINGCKPFRDLDFWEGYFNDCLTNRHWTGDNDRGWRADLEFLTRQEVALKALEAA